MFHGPGRHVPADLLEEYSVGTAGEGLGALIEEHLLICAVCRSRLARIDEFVRTFRAACLRLGERPGCLSRRFRRLLASRGPCALS